MPNSRHTMTITREALIAAAQTSKAWPFQEAQRLAKRMPEGKPGGVLFETGYGPSGLPHIGTFGEVVRTSMVRRRNESHRRLGHAPAAMQPGVVETCLFSE